MSKTPCEKLGYEVGDNFVVIRASERSAARVGDVLKLNRDDGSLNPIFFEVGSGVIRRPHLDNVAKIYADGWIEWKGGDMPVEGGTLVDLMFRDGSKNNPARSAHQYYWGRDGDRSDIVAYRLHQEEKPELEQAEPTLDDLMHAWQKAKANADTSRNILKLAEQDEAAARKALDDALCATGWGDASRVEPLDITDWRDLKPGDVVWWSGRRNFPSGDCVVQAVMRKKYIGSFAFRVQSIGGSMWVDTHHEQWRFIRRPA